SRRTWRSTGCWQRTTLMATRCRQPISRRAKALSETTLAAEATRSAAFFIGVRSPWRGGWRGGLFLRHQESLRAVKPRAVVFDFDGTLVDSYAAITASVNHVREQHGLTPLPEAEVRRFVGHGPAYLLENTVPGAELPADVERYRAHHPSVLHIGTRL